MLVPSAGTVISGRSSVIGSAALGADRLPGKRALTDGKKRIAIFYGAAHMPDLAAQIEKMGFKPVETKWYQAWDTTIRPNEPSAFQKIQERMKQAQQAPPSQ